MLSRAVGGRSLWVALVAKPEDRVLLMNAYAHSRPMLAGPWPFFQNNDIMQGAVCPGREGIVRSRRSAGQNVGIFVAWLGVDIAGDLARLIPHACLILMVVRVTNRFPVAF